MEEDTHRPTASTYPCEAVPRPSWEIATDFGLSLLQHRRDQQPCAPQQLAVHAPRVGVCGEPGEERRGSTTAKPILHPLPHTQHLALTQGTVAVPPCPQPHVPGGRGCKGGAGGSSGGGGPSSWHPVQPGQRHRAPVAVRSRSSDSAWMRACSDGWGHSPRPHAHSVPMVIVVPHEGVEGTQLGPAHAQLLGCVARKATDVSTHQWNPEEVEEQHLCGMHSDGTAAQGWLHSPKGKKGTRPRSPPGTERASCSQLLSTSPVQCPA